MAVGKPRSPLQRPIQRLSILRLKSKNQFPVAIHCANQRVVTCLHVCVEPQNRIAARALRQINPDEARSEFHCQRARAVQIKRLYAKELFRNLNWISPQPEWFGRRKHALAELFQIVNRGWQIERDRTASQSYSVSIRCPVDGVGILDMANLIRVIL